LSDILYPGEDDLSTKSTADGHTWKDSLKSYNCTYDCLHKSADLEQALAAAYVALALTSKDKTPK